jgi:threonine aldolase
VTGGPVDLRSDTLTRPSPAMRRAMAEAEVGDDAYGEDPTVRRLEEAYAARVGKEAGLFLPSGTLANQVALRASAPAGTAIVAGRTSHVARYEEGSAGILQVAQLLAVDDGGGCPDPATVAEAVEGAAHHGIPVSLVCVEDTHMRAGGVPLDGEGLAALAATGVPIHVDGARLFNAEVATGVPAAERVAPATTVWTALSKGLGAPVGSVLAGPAPVVAEARVWRKRFGGQLRQAGVLAAAGLVALEGVERLADDHARAVRLAEAVAERWPGAVDPGTVRTNMVAVEHPGPDAVLRHLASAGVLAGTVAPCTLRLVTSLEVDDAGIDRACRALAAAP